MIHHKPQPKKKHFKSALAHFSCTQLNGLKHWYLTLIFQFSICLRTVKWFQEMLGVINNSIKYQSFVYSQLKDKTVLFQTIQFSISHLFALFKFQTVLFDLLIGPYQLLPLQIRVDLGEILMKVYSTFPKLQHYWSPTLWVFRVIFRIVVVGGSYLSAGMQSVYSTALADWAWLNTCTWPK